MDLELHGLKALVTGSSQGIGKGIAATLAEEGCQVAITGRDNNKVLKTVEGLEQRFGMQSACGFSCDFTVEADVKALAAELAKRWDRLDILVCNVGSGRSVPPLQENLGEWKKMLDVNLLAAAATVEHFLPLLVKSAHPSIVLIASICGVEALGAPVAYSVAKSGLIAMAANMARPLGALGVRINAISPGNILFPGSVWEEKLNLDPEKVEKMLSTEVPLHRLGRVEEIGAAAAFLASPKAGFITGTNLVVDGGQTRSI